jgi:hypothetical protein
VDRAEVYHVKKEMACFSFRVVGQFETPVIIYHHERISRKGAKAQRRQGEGDRV